jgi:parvulin-like peptidyl-prolyl isomerase
MTPPAKSILLIALAGVAAIYLIGDLGVWHGPLRRAVERFWPRGSPVVARVFDVAITRSQLDRAVSARLWLAGQADEALTPHERKLARDAALDELIDHELLRAKAASRGARLVVGEDAIAGCLRRFEQRFESPAAMAAAMKAQGIASERDLRDLLAARIQQEKYLESEIGPLVTPTDEEARQWFASNQSKLALPERVEVRHLFLPTLDHPPEQARAQLAAAAVDLTAGNKDFATLAREISEDPATKDVGGSLGWMTRDRLPADFTSAVFALALHQPSLVRTHLGWHLVEVTGRKPAEPRTYEQAKPEVLAALEAVKRRQVIGEFRAALRRFESSNIEILQETPAE